MSHARVAYEVQNLSAILTFVTYVPNPILLIFEHDFDIKKAYYIFSSSWQGRYLEVRW